MLRPHIQFLLVKFYATPTAAQGHLIVALSGHNGVVPCRVYFSTQGPSLGAFFAWMPHPFPYDEMKRPTRRRTG